MRAFSGSSSIIDDTSHLRVKVRAAWNNLPWHNHPTSSHQRKLPERRLCSYTLKQHHERSPHDKKLVQAVSTTHPGRRASTGIPPIEHVWKTFIPFLNKHIETVRQFSQCCALTGLKVGTSVNGTVKLLNHLFNHPGSGTCNIFFADTSVTWGHFHFCACGLKDPE